MTINIYKYLYRIAMSITLDNSNISVQYSTGSNYIIETVKSDLYRRNEIYDNIVRDNIQTAPVTPSLYIENGTNNVYAVESYTYSGTANTADYTRVFTKSTTCDILIVGGGGAGGGNGQGGGGGAGAVIYYEGLTLNGTYNIKTGKGANATLNQNKGDNGADSEFLKIDNTQRFLAKGGGGGGTYNASGYLPTAGGSGGGGAGNSVGATIVSGNIINGVSVSVLNDNYVNTAFTGNRGINSLNDTGCFGYKGGNETSGGDDSIGAGGGGAGEIGFSTLENQTGNKDIAGNGGSGKKYNISGVEKYYGGGGGGGLRPYPADGSAHGATSVVGSGGNGGGGGGGGRVSVSSDGFDAENGTGGGGGGVGGYASTTFRGGKGGSGIVIIRYLLGTIPSNNLLTSEPVVVAPTFTETVRSFTHSGGAETQTTHTITVGRNTICDILIVGGGGGGGGGHGGGGGAGQLILMHQAILSGTYTIKVGKGGVRGTNPASGGIEPTKGSNSSFDTVIAEGGGANGGTLLKDGGSGAGGDSWLNGLGTIQKGLKNTSIDTYSSGTIYSKGNDGGTGGTDPGQGAGGGGAGTSGGDGKASYTNGGPGNGGDGLSGISELGYDFKTNFGNYGKLESDGNYWFAGGGGGGGWEQTITAVGGKGGGGNGGTGGPVVNGSDAVSNTGSGGGGGSANYGAGGNGGSGIVIIRFKSIANVGILDGITHKRLNLSFDSLGFSFDATKSVEYQTQLKTGVGGWRIVRYLPPNLGRWYYADYITTSTFTIPTIGTPYNYTNEWAVSFGTFDEMFFGTFDMTYWLQCLKTSVLGSYGGVTRPIIKSSSSSTPYSAIWYNRGQNPEDPWISIADHPSLVVYGENSTNVNMSLLNAYGGMCVLVRDSTSGTIIPNPNTYTLNFPVPTIADINNNSNIVLRGAYDIALSTTNAIIIPKAGQYIPKPTTFTNYSVERMYPPVRNFTAATTTLSGQTYGNGTYVVSYSSTYGSGYDPFKCFNTSDIAGGIWADNRYTAGNFNSTSFIVEGYLGDWLKIQLPVAIKLTRFEFLMRNEGSALYRSRSPKDFKIYGSNDGITWVELVTKIDAVYNASYIYEQTTPEITRAYSFYALVVNKLFSTGVLLNFDEWYIYGQEVLPSSLSLRYNLLNPILDPIGAQWTYSSNNTNVYHMGSVGIGTTSPEYHLDVRGNIFSSTGGFTQSGLTTWSIASDRRIKENIVKASYEKCLENVKNIELYNFNFKDNSISTNDRHQLGFIAQEVQQVYPKAVEVGKMMKNNGGTEDILTLNTTQIKYTLYGAVKKLIEKVDNIESKINNLYDKVFITPIIETSNIYTNNS